MFTDEANQSLEPMKLGTPFILAVSLKKDL